MNCLFLMRVVAMTLLRRLKVTNVETVSVVQGSAYRGYPVQGHLGGPATETEYRHVPHHQPLHHTHG